MTTPEETLTSATLRYPPDVMSTIAHRDDQGAILIPWNAPRWAIVDALENLYYGYRHLVDFYTVSETPRSPLMLVFGFAGGADGEPPRPDGPVLELRRGVLREEIVEALPDAAYPFLVGRWVEDETVTLTFDAERAGGEAVEEEAGGEGTAP
jgi:hypothetical protein